LNSTSHAPPPICLYGLIKQPAGGLDPKPVNCLPGMRTHPGRAFWASSQAGSRRPSPFYS